MPRFRGFYRVKRCALGALLMGAAALPVQAEKLTVAVAANFTPVMKALVPDFEQKTGHEVTLISGSSGKIYAQITHGAPYDIFLSADQSKPLALEQAGLIVEGSRLTYAIGQLVLWSPNSTLIPHHEGVLTSDKMRRLALANPKLAPYGHAAQQVLKKLALWDRLRSKLVRGENIAQTFHFVASGNADLGFVALSQVRAKDQGSSWIIPPELYSPLHQDGVILTRARQKKSAQALMSYLQQRDVQRTLRAYGYKLPDALSPKAEKDL